MKKEADLRKGRILEAGDVVITTQWFRKAADPRKRWNVAVVLPPGAVTIIGMGVSEAAALRDCGRKLDAYKERLEKAVRVLRRGAAKRTA